ncbi:MAG: hypothetical protein COT67_01210 [Candidatus Tagabacteria bacterium CG09_land_8_20_14_0_10_41_14]|uniref:Ada DNA repair metal-binding domain-containing protein n=2 Tax=Candidatus Tagaibacteriota TaxID=1817918 RepID=A0A2H0WNN8_9BACT|nr:MAG: hypothetical protein COT67_01210 [Candidatus Tagabacteria bacterium CG09_land_8_20_14_0_10_41_14]PJE73173.1 MAG: hypothetical protein COV00_01195 [Candidatus Tagabacteria bacterium CG10_big_fil_rev_8_21_14_0_10_40_13]
MNLSEKYKRIKSGFKLVENDIILVLVILFVGFIAFGLGRLSALSERKTPISVENLMSEVEPHSLDEGGSTSIIESATASLYVASKNGTKYHYPWCSGAQRINIENKIWFLTKEEAEAAGYTPAANCKGL